MIGSAEISLVRAESHWTGRFVAMACPCEVLIEDCAEDLARAVLDAAAEHAWRIERKFSRYRTDNIVHRINTSNGRATLVDAETARLLDFAATLTKLSDGGFDITSGVLRKAWTFDGGNRVPTQAQIDALLRDVGWHKALWDRTTMQLRLQPGMQIDFGGIGKEYAVDAAARIADAVAPGLSCLINLGGDIAVVNARRDGESWNIGIESVDRPGVAARTVQLARGALATSGDSRRFVLHRGCRYSHILDARTGWPVNEAPRSITVGAATCTQAGTLTTLAMLAGVRAQELLEAGGSTYWLQ
ncbi:MAG: FAD:protein FMN transferase [Steroidobacteraceae bacterium]